MTTEELTQLQLAREEAVKLIELEKVTKVDPLDVIENVYDYEVAPQGLFIAN